MKIIDAHTHIDYITYDFQPEVEAVVCCAVGEVDWKKIINLMKDDNRVYGAFGIHPWYVNDARDGWGERLEKLLKTDNRYMVGEIGLDKHRPDMENQIDVFIKQFDIAVNLKRIVFLHCVGAWDKILHILKQYKKSELPKIVVHNFNENENILTNLLQYENVFFSLSKNAVYGKNCRIEQIPLNRILVETDGKNIDLIGIVNEIGKIKNESNIVNVIYNNTQRILKYG